MVMDYAAIVHFESFWWTCLNEVFSFWSRLHCFQALHQSNVLFSAGIYLHSRIHLLLHSFYIQNFILMLADFSRFFLVLTVLIVNWSSSDPSCYIFQHCELFVSFMGSVCCNCWSYSLQFCGFGSCMYFVASSHQFAQWFVLWQSTDFWGDHSHRSGNSCCFLHWWSLWWASIPQCVELGLGLLVRVGNINHCLEGKILALL